MTVRVTRVPDATSVTVREIGDRNKIAYRSGSGILPLNIFFRGQIQHEIYVLCPHPTLPGGFLVFEELESGHSSVDVTEEPFKLMVRAWQDARDRRVRS